MTQKKRERLYDAAFLIVWLVVAIFLILKARYGYGNRDESFYLTIPKRLLQGDALLVEEWHVSQLSALLLLPIMKLYLAINPTCVGMILHFRLIYVGVQAICTLLLYSRLKRYSHIGAAFGSLLFMIYAPFGISALSYNSMGVELFALSTALLATRPSFRKKVTALLYDVAVGLLFSGAVLCQPYLAALYIVYALCVLINFITRRKACKNDTMSISTFIGVSIGVAAALLMFAVFLLSRASVSEIMDAVPMILSDPEHPGISLWYTVKLFFNYIIYSNAYSPVCYGLLCPLLLLAAFDRRSRVRKNIYFACTAVITVVYTLGFADTTIVNCLMMPINLLGIVCFFLLATRPHSLFLGVYLPTVFYAWAISATSNQCFLVVSSAFSAAAVVSAVFIVMYVTEDRKNLSLQDRLFRSLAAALPCLLIMSLVIFVRGNYNFWDSETSALDQKIESGVNCGVITTEYYANAWERLLADTTELREIKKGNVLYFSTETAMYLSDDKGCSAFSTWISIGDKTEDEVKAALLRLSDYYALNPDKRPDYIYVDINTSGTKENIVNILGLRDYEMQTTKYGNTVIVCHDN